MNYLNSILKNLKIKSTIAVSAVVIGASGIGLAIPLTAHAANCAPTGFYQDGLDLTAVVGDINPTSPVTGTVNASGCNIGVFYGPGTHGTVNNATITDSNYYGVVVQGANVNIENSNVNTIGETPLNGDQHGVGIYYATLTSGSAEADGVCTTGSTKGTVNNDSVSTYQKDGIVAHCTGTNVNIENNVVQGQGPVDYIAQNGIEIGVGATAVVNNNYVTDNSYTGTGGSSSGGILVYGGEPYGGVYTTNTQITNNIVIGNDVGIWLSNLSACSTTTCTAAASRTNIDVTGNTVSNAELNNTTGNSTSPAQGYQAGISDQGDHDTIVGNTITGAGYNPASSSLSISTTWIDVSSTNNVKLHNHNYFGYGYGNYF